MIKIRDMLPAVCALADTTLIPDTVSDTPDTKNTTFDMNIKKKGKMEDCIMTNRQKVEFTKNIAQQFKTWRSWHGCQQETFLQVN